VHELAGKNAVVTGAGSGIGRAASEVFAGAGANVVAVDLDASAAEETAQVVDGVAVVGDVSDPGLWTEVVATADAAGGLDVAYLNAGLYGWAGPIEELPVDLYQRTVAANIGGVVLGTRAAVPAMRARGGGAIVVTASVAGIVPFAGNPLYTLTKQGVAGFVVALAPNLAADGITINAVCPGPVDTPMTSGALGGADPADFGFDLIPPEAIAEAALLLATSEGTGRCLAVRAKGDRVDWSHPTWRDLAAEEA
jgi:NAD(P)-dependent dehydrogenase (short-subunit alcohol dehydrogenase family)